MRRWLLQLIWLPLIVACASEQAVDVRDSSTPPWFEEVAQDRGLRFEHVSGHADQKFYMPEIVCGGAALFDMDGDGDLDAYLVQGGSLHEEVANSSPNRLYENLGDGRFEEVTSGSGAGDTGYGMGVAAADYDLDGDVDLYVTNVGANTLLRNEGGGRFTDQTATSNTGHEGLGASAVFFDYDRDGDPDLYVSNYLHWSAETENDCHGPVGEATYCSPRAYNAPSMDVLYRNNGDGSFTDVTEAMGIAAGFGNGLGVVAADFDRDGWLDIYVANDGNPNQLWINLEGQGFQDIALVRGCAIDEDAVAKAGMGVTTNDVDDDGDLDILVCNLYEESDSFYRNEGTYFVETASSSGLGVAPRMFTRFGLGWIDFNNDGYLDLFEASGRVSYQPDTFTDDPYAEPNLLFEGTAGGMFEEVKPRGGTMEPLIATSRAAAFGDVDGDGGIDILIVNRDLEAHLLRNVVPDRGNWVAFQAFDANGAEVEGTVVTATVNGRAMRRDLRVGFSYLAANSSRIHFGLGDATRIDDVVVQWLDGTRESFGSFDAGQVVALRRGQAPAN